MLFASLCFALMGGFAKELSKELDSLEIVFFRNVAGVLLIALTLYKSPIKQIGGRPWLLFFRGFMGFCALLAFFYNIAHIPLAEAMTYSKAAPIFTAIFAMIFLKEKIGIFGWIGIFLGFFGMIFIMKPTGIGGFDKYDILGFFSAVGAALAYTSIRELRKYYDTRSIVLSFMVIGTVGPIVLMIISKFFTISWLDFMFGEFVMPSGKLWLYIIGMGVFATLAQTYMTKAYTVTNAGIVGAISYSNILFSILVGLYLGDMFPDIFTMFGIILIILSGILVTKKGKK